MSEDFKRKLQDYISNRVGVKFSDESINTIIDLCRDHFLRACCLTPSEESVPPGMEEWWIGVIGNGEVNPTFGLHLVTSSAWKDKDALARSDYQHIVRILLPKPETARKKLIRELREWETKVRNEYYADLKALLTRAADELEKVEG